MDLSKISVGKNSPEEINVIIEVPSGSNPVKYEFDKEAGVIVVDRFIPTAMHYPCNYGFIPHTMGGDGDPLDVLVVSRYPVVPGAMIACRPIGMLMMEDESGVDEKILAVPTKKRDPYYENIRSYSDLPQVFLDQISHFFEHYKDLEKGKWVKVQGWKDVDDVYSLIRKSIQK